MIKYNCTFDADKQGTVLQIALRGEIDHHSAVQIRTEIDERIYKERPSKTVLDLSAIEFMDSSGLGLIMGRYSLMKKLGGELTLRNPHERIVQIFTMAGLQRMVTIEDSEEKAKEKKV